MKRLFALLLFLIGTPARALSPEAQALVDQAFADVPSGKLVDYHVHMLGLGAGGTGAELNPRMRSWWHPLQRIKALIYLRASGITDEDQADPQYLTRLLSLIRDVKGHGRHAILAFDRHYNPDGTVNAAKSEFHTPNDYVLDLAGRHPDAFIPVVSVHPYRKDAVAELERCAERGARIVKWLPNAMGIDASAPRADEFYRAMVRLGMVLLTHVGEEKAVESRDDQALGNPLLFRRPLDMGVKVIMAHAGSLGDNADLDHPGERTGNFDLVMRLMDEPRYRDLLFIDISAMTQFNRVGPPLLTLLRRPDLAPRMVNGSDYPLPAIGLMVQTRALVDHGLITPEERQALNEIFKANPLLFDYVVKRTLRHPETGDRFPASVFLRNPHLPD